MRHKNAGRKFGRTPSHRKALLRNLAKALILNDRITTTLTKAKTLRGVVEPLVTLALRKDLHARRQAYQVLGEHEVVRRLFDEIAPRFAQGGGGYTRVVKLAVPRKGDAAPLAIIEFVTPVSAEEQESAKKAAPKKAAPKKKEEVAPVQEATAPAEEPNAAPEALAEESSVEQDPKEQA